MHRLIFWVVFFLMISFGVLSAAEKTITANYTYAMGENDSRNDARRHVFFEAEKKLIQVSERFVRDNSDTKKWKVDNDDIETFLPVLITIDRVKEEWDVDGDDLNLTVSVKTKLDSDYVLKRISEIRKDKTLKAKIIRDRKKFEALEKEYNILNSRLKKDAGQAAVELRKQRQAIAERMDRLEKIKYFITSKTRLAEEKIAVGMTIDEVIDVAGQPRATMACERPDFLNYGRIWVMLRNGVVTNLVPVEDWQGPCLEYGRRASKKQSEPATSPGEAEHPKFEIILKNGKAIPTSNYYEIEGVVYYKRYGGIVGIEKTKIAEINDIN